MAGTAVSLDQLLMLVGELNDQQGNDTPRDRFRQFLSSSVTALGTVRDYVDVCLAQKGNQYDLALQDLVNHAGRLMGFDVEFGRYSGVVNDIGHDGLWKADSFSVVVEVKTTDAFTIRTAALLGYINSLTDEGTISHADTAMGLYIFGKPSAELSQLEASIIHGGHAQRLRIATVDYVPAATAATAAGGSISTATARAARASTATKAAKRPPAGKRRPLPPCSRTRLGATWRPSNSRRTTATRY